MTYIFLSTTTRDFGFQKGPPGSVLLPARPRDRWRQIATKPGPDFAPGWTGVPPHLYIWSYVYIYIHVFNVIHQILMTLILLWIIHEISSINIYI